MASNLQLDSESISQRAQDLLKHLVELYVQHGHPVGSKTLAQQAKLNLSPATIRKVMSDLEDLGFVHSPHTSAGRVPTAKGFRFFVDSLLSFHPLDGSQLKKVKSELDPSIPTDNLISTTSSLLSEMSRMVGVITLPKHNKLVLKHVEFLPLADNRVLVVLVVNDKEVQNRIILTERAYSAPELQQASNFLMQHFAGKDLSQSRDELLSAMHKDRLNADRLMQTVLDVATKAFNQSERKEFIMAGEGNLVVQTQPQAMEDLQKLYEAFNQKTQVLHLLDACLQSEGVQLFIGEESGYDAFKSCSLVTSRYKINDEVVGVLGVIGPTRMKYDQIIPIVDITAKLLGEALNPESEAPYSL